MQPSEAESLALRCVPGHGGVELKRVGAGLVNDTYRVVRDGRSYSLRCAAQHPSGLGLDRGWECRVLRCASAAGVAPRVEHCDPVTGILVADWVPGCCWTPVEAKQPERIEALGRFLRDVHALASPRPARVMTPAAWIDLYAGLAPPLAATLRFEADRCVAWLAADAVAPPAVLCHGDLHRLNLVAAAAGPPRLLDWEYAHVSEPFWDLAGWVANEDWDAEPARRLVTVYLGRSPSATEWMRLTHLLWLYDYVCLVWSAQYLTNRAQDSHAAVAARAMLLTARLQRGAGSRGGQVPAH